MWPWQTVSCAICRRRWRTWTACWRSRTPRPHPRPRCKPLPTCRPAQLQYWLDETIAALQGGELASDALDALQQHASCLDIQPLQEAVDAFDFDRALECAHALKKQWTLA
jgi:hypothetical protein